MQKHTEEYKHTPDYKKYKKQVGSGCRTKKELREKIQNEVAQRRQDELE